MRPTLIVVVILALSATQCDSVAYGQTPQFETYGENFFRKQFGDEIIQASVRVYCNDLPGNNGPWDVRVKFTSQAGPGSNVSEWWTTSWVQMEEGDVQNFSGGRVKAALPAGAWDDYDYRAEIEYRPIGGGVISSLDYLYPLMSDGAPTGNDGVFYANLQLLNPTYPDPNDRYMRFGLQYDTIIDYRIVVEIVQEEYDEWGEWTGNYVEVGTIESENFPDQPTTGYTSALQIVTLGTGPGNGVAGMYFVYAVDNDDNYTSLYWDYWDSEVP